MIAVSAVATMTTVTAMFAVATLSGRAFVTVVRAVTLAAYVVACVVVVACPGVALVVTVAVRSLRHHSLLSYTLRGYMEQRSTHLLFRLSTAMSVLAPSVTT